MVERGRAVEVEIGGELDELVGRRPRCARAPRRRWYSRARGRRARSAVTPAPTLSTTPANSPPGENGNGGLVWYLPAMISVSKKLSPTAATLATTSPGPATGSGMSASTRSSGGAEAGAENGFHGCGSIVDGRQPTMVGGATAIGARRGADDPMADHSALKSLAIGRCRARRRRLHIAEFASYSMRLVDCRASVASATEEGR